MKIAIVCLSKNGCRIACQIASSPLGGEGCLPAGQAGGEGDIYVPEKIKQGLPRRYAPRNDKTGGTVIASPEGAWQSHKYNFPLSNLIKSIFNKYDALVFVMALGIVVRSIAPLLTNKSNDPAIITIDEGANFCISTLGGHEAGANKLTKTIAKTVQAKEIITTASESSHITLGIGLKKHKTKQEITEAITSALQKKNLDLGRIKEILTIDLKKDDQALIDACSDLKIPLRFVSKEQINALESGFSTSEFVIASIGAKAVCEPAALIGSENKQLIMKKTAFNGVTIALAR